MDHNPFAPPRADAPGREKGTSSFSGCGLAALAVFFFLLVWLSAWL